MAGITQDILPYHLKRKWWKSPLHYVLRISQDKRARGEQASIRCSIPTTLIMEQLNEKSAVIRLQMRRPAFNGTRDYNKLQWIFAKLMSLSRDIHIRTHRSGSFWKILNEQQIREQWPGVKRQIKEMYEDPLVEDILKRHEQNLTHHFQSLYRREPVLHFLFNDLFHNYLKEEPAETDKVLPQHLGTTPFPITERKQLTQLEPVRREALITVEGSPDANRIDTEAVNNYLGQAAGKVPEQPYRFTYKGIYQLDTSQGCIREASLRVEGTMGETYQKRTTYNLTPRPSSPLNETAPFTG